jgi:hypothetical protein
LIPIAWYELLAFCYRSKLSIVSEAAKFKGIPIDEWPYLKDMVRVGLNDAPSLTFEEEIHLMEDRYPDL